MLRPTPFELVFRAPAEEIFPTIRDALHRAGHDPRSRDAFLMVREVVALLRELRPEGGLGEGIDQLAALVHHAYLFWDTGSHTVQVSTEQLTDLLGHADTAEVPSSCYVSFPERRIWAEVVPGLPPEPLDGCFIHSGPDERILSVLGVFGIHPEREGFSVVETVGPRPQVLERADGTPLFTPALAGGKAAGLFSIVEEEELLELAWRTQQFGAGSWELGANGSELGVAGSQLPAPSS